MQHFLTDFLFIPSFLFFTQIHGYSLGGDRQLDRGFLCGFGFSLVFVFELLSTFWGLGGRTEGYMPLRNTTTHRYDI
jgi:hypothetical protein